MAPNSLGRCELALDQHQSPRFAGPACSARSPMLPEATCAFCALMALVTSSAVRPNPTSSRRVDPDAQRAFGGYSVRAADAGNAPDLAQHIARP